MSSVSVQTTAVPSHSHSLAPGPVITSSIISVLHSPSPSSSPIVSGSGSLPAAASPTETPSTPSSTLSTYTQKKLSLTLALIVFLPAVINAL
ncbi:hypothetical protein BG015_008343 [Linnemannia schmuckeri]|uniref:Uncharacterized protein n=1 Tax=Linnemannia schmuckeri TaxID=64567 RepID=A0A9P5RZR8_9FUNG|nr:hypothetical protein BG015_008343 [Linnemannia schmuckeri]